MMALVKQLIGMLTVIWVVVTGVFILLHLAPGDPVGIMLGESVGMDEGLLRKQLGLDLSLWYQYQHFYMVSFRAIGDIPFFITSQC